MSHFDRCQCKKCKPFKIRTRKEKIPAPAPSPRNIRKEIQVLKGLVGECLKCKRKARPGVKHCTKHRTIIEAVYKRNQETRLKVIAKYGAKCVCCKESNMRLLTFDHVNNDGKLHRQSIGNTMCTWLIKNNFPSSIQLLCYNCNIGKYHNKGKCPHQEESNNGLDNRP